MTIPGFTAQASLGRASGTYCQGIRSTESGRVQPALSFLDFIRLLDCARNWHCLRFGALTYCSC